MATQDDLWEHLTKCAQSSHTFDNLTNVKQIMDTWTSKTGFPVVTVIRNYTSPEVVRFEQSRFTLVPQSRWKALNMKFEDALWWIPLSYTTSIELNFTDTHPSDWIRGTERFTKQFENLTENDWILLNIQSTGNFNCHYTTILFLFTTNYRTIEINFARLLSS